MCHLCQRNKELKKFPSFQCFLQGFTQVLSLSLFHSPTFFLPLSLTYLLSIYLTLSFSSFYLCITLSFFFTFIISFSLSLSPSSSLSLCPSVWLFLLLPSDLFYSHLFFLSPSPSSTLSISLCVRFSFSLSPSHALFLAFKYELDKRASLSLAPAIRVPNVGLADQVNPSKY